MIRSIHSLRSRSAEGLLAPCVDRVLNHSGRPASPVLASRASLADRDLFLPRPAMSSRPPERSLRRLSSPDALNGRVSNGVSSSRGFTLLEVLVAIAILGLGLTVILSSQVGLFTSTSRGAHLTVASNLLRCKMSEIELMLDQKGFSLTDENDEGECCADESEGYTCSWKLERVELPPLPEPSMDQDGGAPPAGSAGLALGGPGAIGGPLGLSGPGATPGAAPGGLGALGALGALGGLGGPPGAPGGKVDPAAIMSQLSGSGSSGMEGMVMGLVYPSLKPMLEASIRRITVKVMWKEGMRARDLEVTQFLTRPQEGMLGTADQVGLGQTMNALQGLIGGPAAGATPGATPGATTPTTGSILK
jgi:general secretion pathway protein I